MPQFFLDHGIYGAANRIGLDAPAWASPQDGDGSASTPATASSVGEIQIKGIPADGKVIIIAGATITAKTTVVAKNQFLIGASAAATATNIVNLINTYGTGNNQCDAAVGTGVARALGNLAERLPNMVYARIKPTTTDVVELMFRIGSAQLNKANNGNVAITQSTNWNGTDTTADSNVGNGGIVEFAGGSGGCFGWFQNKTAVGVSSSIAIGNYGIYNYGPSVCANGTGVSNYALTIYDPVECRNGRSITHDGSTGLSLGRGTGCGALWLRVDDGTIWSGDSPSGVFSVMLNTAANSTVAFAASCNPSELIVEARQKWGMKIGIGGVINNGTTALISFGGASPSVAAYFRNVEFTDYHTVPHVVSLSGGLLDARGSASNTQVTTTFECCRFSWLAARNSNNDKQSFGIGHVGSYNGSAVARFLDCDWYINWNGAQAPTTGLFTTQGAAGGGVQIEILGGRATGAAQGFQLITGTLILSNFKFVCDGLEGVNFGSAILGVQQNGTGNLECPDSRVILLSLPKAGRPWRYENAVSVADWVPDAGYPTLYSRLGGVLPISTRALWIALAGSARNGRGFSVPMFISEYRDATGPVTVRLHMWLRSGVAFSQNNFTFAVNYLDSTGASKTVIKKGADIVSSTAPWNSGGGSYVTGYEARKLELSLPSVLSGTLAYGRVVLMGMPNTAVNENIFFDPEFEMVAA